MPNTYAKREARVRYLAMKRKKPTRFVKKKRMVVAINRPRFSHHSYGFANPFPARKFVTHVYTDSLSLTSGAAGVFGTELVYRINDTFDPQFSLGGHQPYGRDQCAAIYGRFKVYSCKVELVVTEVSATDVYFGVKFNNPTNLTPTLSGQTYALDERAYTYVYPQMVYGATGKPFKFTKFIKMNKLFDMTPQAFANSIEVSSASGASIDSLYTCFVRFAIGDYSGTGGRACRVHLKLTYGVLWSERTDLGQS